MNISAKIIFIRLFCFLPALLLMILIFSLSAEPAYESSQTSSGVIKFFFDSFYPDFESISPEIQTNMIENMQFFARKTAHFLIYTALGFCVLFAFLPYNMKTSIKTVVSIMIAFLYAVSDEVHQYFIPGRACQLRDVIIDFAGIIFGILIFSLLRFLISKIKN